MSWTAMVLASVATIDVSGACGDVRQRLHEWNARRECLTDDARISVTVARWEFEDSLRVELTGTSSTQATVVRMVNSCEEVFNVVKFEVELGCFEPPSAAPPGDPSVPATTLPRLGIEAFSVTSSNYPEWYGFGAGGGLSLAFDALHVGAYGAWMQPALLQSPRQDVARYDLHRVDFQALSCLDVATDPVRLSPCFGANLSWFSVPRPQLSGAYDNTGGTLGVDAGLAISKPWLVGSTFSAALLLRYALIPFDPGNLKVGEFAPRTFEVNLRLGFTFDLWDFNQRGYPRSDERSVARRRGVQSW